MQPQLPPGWICQFDPASQKQFFVNTANGQTSWTIPSPLPNSSPYDYPLSDPDCQQKVALLKAAFKGMGTDEKTLNRVLASSSPLHLRQISVEYAKKHGKDLRDAIKSETSGDYQKLCLEVMMCNEGELDAYWIHNACAGAGTNESALTEILVGRSNQDIQYIVQAFRTVSGGKELGNVLKSELSGEFEIFFVNGVLQGRPPMAAADLNADIATLYKSGEKKMGTDEKKFISVFCGRPMEHLRYVFDGYERAHGKSMAIVVKSEFSGNLETALQETSISTILFFYLLVKSVYNPAERVADYLYKAMQGVGTHDDNLRRLVVMNRSPRLMTAIKAAFLQKYQKPLAVCIKAETSGDYEKLLVELIGEI